MPKAGLKVTAEDLLARIKAQPDGKVSYDVREPKQIAKALGYPPNQHGGILSCLSELARQGKVKQIDGPQRGKKPKGGHPNKKRTYRYVRD